MVATANYEFIDKLEYNKAVERLETCRSFFNDFYAHYRKHNFPALTIEQLRAMLRAENISDVEKIIRGELKKTITVPAGLNVDKYAALIELPTPIIAIFDHWKYIGRGLKSTHAMASADNLIIKEDAVMISPRAKQGLRDLHTVALYENREFEMFEIIHAIAKQLAKLHSLTRLGKEDVFLAGKLKGMIQLSESGEIEIDNCKLVKRISGL